MALEQFGIGVLGSIAGGLTVLLVQYVARKTIEERAPLTGSWENHIFDEAGTLVKRDALDVRQRGERINGSIRRVEPSDQTHR